MGENSGGGIPPDKGVKEFVEESMEGLEKVGLDKLPKNKETIKENVKEKENRIKEFYEPRDTGPFQLYIESKGEGEGIGRLHPMKIGQIILKHHPNIGNSITDIEKAGKNRLKVILKNGSSANTLLESPILNSKNFEVYIPQFLVRRRGVIRDVDISLGEEEILEHVRHNLGANVRLIKVKRFFRKVKDDSGNINLKPTGTVFLTFRGQNLPQYVYIYFSRCMVEPYSQEVVQCFKCLRYGHVNAQCKGKARCGNCSEEHEENTCPNKELKKCVHCQQNHSSTDKNKCPEYLKQKAIKDIMSTEHIAFREAKQRIKSRTFSRALMLDLKQDFPPLTPYRNENNSTNNEQKQKKRRGVSPPHYSQNEINFY
ncbi:uncharacterized protein [Rhodnius prolixus]|uniref:uncharacterized protein n=1 Tax=Rhodnius prolixus TaxID=13249 RepID=UPI003D18C20C